MGKFRCIPHPSATRQHPCGPVTVRLACVRHAASVHSEPGSNSSVEIAKPSELAFIQLKTLERDLSYFDYSNYDSKIRLRTQVSRLGTLLIRWTCIHPKAPTQVTCAHCQRSQIRTGLNIRLPTSVSPEGAAYYTSRSRFVNDLPNIVAPGLACP